MNVVQHSSIISRFIQQLYLLKNITNSRIINRTNIKIRRNYEIYRIQSTRQQAGN